MINNGDVQAKSVLMSMIGEMVSKQHFEKASEELLSSS